MNDIPHASIEEVDTRMLTHIEVFVRNLRLRMEDKGSLRPDQRNIVTDMVARIIYQPGA